MVSLVCGLGLLSGCLSMPSAGDLAADITADLVPPNAELVGEDFSGPVPGANDVSSLRREYTTTEPAEEACAHYAGVARLTERRTSVRRCAFERDVDQGVVYVLIDEGTVLIDVVWGDDAR